MENIVFLIFRRMRAPLLALSVVYSVTILGMVLIAGRDADGNRWYMNFFHSMLRVAVFNGDREEQANLLRKLKTDLPYRCLCEKIQAGATPVLRAVGDTA